MRLRKQWKPMQADQLSAQKGAQTLDGSTALTHLIHLAQERKQGLFALKLDIAQAFDRTTHDAVARFLNETSVSREAGVLFHIITNSKVHLRMGKEEWTQELK